ncbi:MAG TPA: hypothetical protein VIP77_08885 [Jiangellaceae bacterium]
MTLTVDHRFRGPTTSGNGGYVCGMVAARLGSGGATVTLRTPPPLGRAMTIAVDDGELQLLDGSTLVAEATTTTADHLPEVEPLDARAARELSLSYPGLDLHPFPECFVCGPRREPGDGMRLFPGRVGDGRTACVWDVAADLAGRPEFVWAALDCPGGWSAPIEGRPMVLGRLTGEVVATPEAGEACVAMGELTGTDGRKSFTATTLYGSDGRVLGRARAIWIALPGSPDA